MAGFNQDPIQFINLIADNLRDRYQSGFPVIKELIQNTDDSNATDLHFGLSPGIPDASHPLLNGPSLFLINNGDFKPSDAVGIRSFGQNSKAADDASIGKFGLGMKSVFHFCEAFFFLAHDGRKSYTEVLNPWSGADPEQSLHSEWDNFEENDGIAIREHLSGICSRVSSNPEQLFVLWLPLRKKIHQSLKNGETSGVIVSEYPGDDPALLDFLNDAELPTKIASLMPMLRHLKHVGFWKADGKVSEIVPEFEVLLNDGAQRLSLITKPKDNAPSDVLDLKPLKGKFKIMRGESQQSLEFSGLESYGWNVTLDHLHQNELWPSSYVRDEYGHSREAKDKAKPHGTVFFSRVKGGGRMFTNWSVFLPLDEHKAMEMVRCPGDYDYRLTLHGYFFIDAGRQGVYGLAECPQQVVSEYTDESSLRQAWNCELLQSGVFPLVLPALDAFCREQRLADKACTALTEALFQTRLYQNFGQQITAIYSWVREINIDGIRWQLRKTTYEVLQLPEPPSTDVERPWRLFKGLKKIGKQKLFTVQGSPNLLHVDAQWSEEEILTLLESVDVHRLFSESTLLDYLAKFLDEVAGPYLKSLSVQSHLAGLIKQGLIKIGESGLGQNQQRIKEIASQLDANRCFKIDDGMPKGLLMQLLSANSDVLLLPARFYPWTTGSAASLSHSDAYHFLEKVESALQIQDDSKNLQSAALKISEQFIRAVSAEDRSNLLSRCAEMRVLGGYDCKLEWRTPVSVRDIKQASDNGVLFGLSQGTNQEKRLRLAPLLQKVLPRERVLLINAETSKLALETTRAISPCDGNGVLKALGQSSRLLGGVKARSKLAGEVGSPDGDIEIRGLRFLLHADEEHFHDDGTLWVLGYEQEEVWQKLWSQLVGGEIEPWNLLDSEIVKSVPQTVWPLLHIKEIQRTSVIEDLERHDLSALDTSEFSEDECEQILLSVTEEELWQTLPFHWTRQGIPVVGNLPNAFLESKDTPLDSKLLSDIHLIPLSDNPDLAYRQSRWLNLLNDHAAISILLDKEDAPLHCLLLMDALERIYDREESIDSELCVKIRMTAWLPAENSTVFKPEDVIDLEVAADEIGRVLAHVPDAFVTPIMLTSGLLEHSFFVILRKTYFSHEEAGLNQLSLFLGELDQYQIGQIKFTDADSLEETTRLLTGYNYAGWQLLVALVEKMGADICLSSLVPALTGKMPLHNLVALLNWIPGRGGELSAAKRVFNRYLKVFAQTTGSSDVLPKLKLLSKAKNWQPADLLVSGGVGISASHMLDAKQVSILSGLVYQNQRDQNSAKKEDRKSAAAMPAATAGILHNYFQSWSGRVSDSTIGAIILLFGCDQSVKDLSDDFMGQHSRDWLIEELPWVVPMDNISNGRAKEWLYGCSLNDALERFSVTLHIHKEAMIKVESILGDSILVELEKDFSTLFVGSPSYTSQGGKDYLIKLAIRELDVGNSSDEQLSRYLRASTEYLLKEAYNQKSPNLAELWSELDQSDQIDIDLARALILDSVPFYLKQLGAHKHPLLESKLSSYRKAERKEKEFKGREKETTYRKDKERALQELQSVIESDAGVQEAILNSVRKKVRDYQYQPDSVPFELFQNADDAVHDLEKIEAYPSEPGGLDVEPLPSSVCRVVIEAERDQILFMHWGRAVNQCGSIGYPGLEKGFDRDLENMLILSASDKGEGVTGKFGLGFKSVWLISDRPVVVSGRLQTEIVGGLLPVPLKDAVAIRNKLASEQPDKKWLGTAISIPLTEVDENRVLDQFSAMAGALVAFSRSVRSISIKRADGRLVTVNWDGRKLIDNRNLLIGRIRQSNGDPLLVVKFNLDDGAILLAIGPGGFVELPREFPNIWVTAPIREQERLGFAINAMFEVDAGRSRLSAAVEENRELAVRIGKQFGAALEELHNVVSTQWEDAAADMELLPECGPYQFWHSLWKMFFTHLPRLDKESSMRIIATKLAQGGFGRLVKSAKIIPNGLPTGMERLLCANEIKLVLKGALSEERIVTVVADTDCFQPMMDAEKAISSEIVTGLRIIDPEFDKRMSLLMPLSLQGLVAMINRDNVISATDANTLGKALNKRVYDEWRAPESEVPKDAVTDFTRAIEGAGDLRFLSATGKHERAKKLLTHLASEEENRRWILAPDQCRLSREYDADGVEFFRLCRDKMDAPANTICEWIFNADDDARREAALRYLIEGELAWQAADLLQQQDLSGSWLIEVGEESDYLTGWDQSDVEKLVYQILKTPEESKNAFVNSVLQDPHLELEPIDPTSALENIYSWWKSERDEQLDAYKSKTYPEGLGLNLAENDDAGRVDRSSWLKLLLLGGFHTMGRTLPGQHRKFIEDCQQKGWWDVFIDSSPQQHFDDWMRVLDEYIDRQVDNQEYEQWMMRFPIIYKLSRYLDDYVELILGLDRYPRSFDLESVLTSRVNPDQQGGGIAAPPLGRTLGKGSNFIVREAIRHGVVNGEYVNEHAFVPYRRVSQLLSEMGCEGADWSEVGLKASPNIFRFVCGNMEDAKETFCGDYDIPLRIVSQDRDLQEELLGRAMYFEEGW